MFLKFQTKFDSTQLYMLKNTLKEKCQSLFFSFFLEIYYDYNSYQSKIFKHEHFIYLLIDYLVGWLIGRRLWEYSAAARSGSGRAQEPRSWSWLLSWTGYPFTTSYRATDTATVRHILSIYTNIIISIIVNI